MLRLVPPLLAVLLALPAAAQAPRKKIERADQLPPRAYKVEVKPSALVADPKATDALAEAVRALRAHHSLERRRLPGKL